LTDRTDRALGLFARYKERIVRQRTGPSGWSEARSLRADGCRSEGKVGASASPVPALSASFFNSAAGVVVVVDVEVVGSKGEAKGRGLRKGLHGLPDTRSYAAAGVGTRSAWAGD
jgi:hypothetical protein